MNFDELDDDFDLDTLLDATQPNLPSLPIAQPAYTYSSALWPIGLLRDLALGIEDEEAILTKHGFTVEQFDAIRRHPKFKQEFSSVARSLQASGELFISRASAQAEDYLLKMDEIIHANDTDRKTQLHAICKVVEWSGLAAKSTARATASDNPSQTNVQININL